MATLAELREKRNSHIREMKNMLDNNTSKWDKDLQARYDGHSDELERIDAQIKNVQTLLDAEAEQRFGLSGVDNSSIHHAGHSSAGVNGAASDEAFARQTYNKWMRGGDKVITAEEWGKVQNAMSTGAGSEGGYTVPIATVADVLEAIKDYSALRGSGLCEIIQTTNGNEIKMPTSDGTDEEGELVPENQPATDLDPDFGVLGLSAYKFSSKVVTVPFELLQDSSIDVEAFVRGRFASRLGRVLEKYYTLGTGVSQPKGLVTASSVGVVAATGGATSVTYENLVDLEHSVNAVYRKGKSCAFMVHDKTVRFLRKIKDSEGRPIFVPNEGGAVGGVPASLMGFPLLVNDYMAELGANNKSIGFGNLGYYKIRDVKQMEVFRFTDSAYTKKGQVGFLAWVRSGGNLMDVGGCFKLFQNSAT